MEIVSHSLEETWDAAKTFLEDLEIDGGKSVVVGLSGELGSGKTTFTKGVADALGVEKEGVTSPTFVLQKIYPIKDNPRFTQLVHMDAYRLESANELSAFDWLRAVNDEGSLILVEWPENVKEALPEDSKKIVFETVDEETRKITW